MVRFIVSRNGILNFCIIFSVANYARNTQKFYLNVADVQKTPVGIMFWLFDKEKRCLLGSSIKIAVLKKTEKNKNCVKAIKKRYHKFVSGQYFNLKDERWISFDVSAVIAKVLRNVRNAYKSMDTAKLMIVVKNKCTSSKVNTRNPRQSYIEITTNDQPPAIDCFPGVVRCCRQPIAVTSVDLLSKGLGVVIPRMFKTGYCTGTCGGHAGGSQCCTATKTVLRNFLYADKHVLRKGVSHHVIECGCR